MNQPQDKWRSGGFSGGVSIVDGDAWAELVKLQAFADEPAASRKTESPRRNTPLSPGPESWRKVAESFLDAGADVLVTPLPRWPDRAGQAVAGDADTTGPVDQTTWNRDAASAYRAAVDGHARRASVLLLGALAPVDALLTLGEIDEAALTLQYRATAAALAAGGVDGIICRAFTELDALVAAVRAARAQTGLPVIATMCFDCGPERMDTALGVSVPQACEALADLGVAAIGCDGGQSPDTAAAVVARLKDAGGGKPVWVTATPGTRLLDAGQVVYPETPKTFAERYKTLAKAGAGFIGGAQGATAAHIAALLAPRAAAARAASKKGDKTAG